LLSTQISVRCQAHNSLSSEKNHFCDHGLLKKFFSQIVYLKKQSLEGTGLKKQKFRCRLSKKTFASKWVCAYQKTIICTIQLFTLIRDSLKKQEKEILMNTQKTLSSKATSFISQFTLDLDGTVLTTEKKLMNSFSKLSKSEQQAVIDDLRANLTDGYLADSYVQDMFQKFEAAMNTQAPTIDPDKFYEDMVRSNQQYAERCAIPTSFKTLCSTASHTLN